MTIALNRITTSFFCAALLVLATGCVDLKPQIDGTRYFVLSAPSISSGVKLETAKVVGIDNFSRSPYLDRPMIVTRKGQNEIAFSSINRWGNELRQAIPKHLERHLESSRSVRSLQSLPWPDDIQPDLRLSLDISRFEGASSGTSGIAVVAGSWTLRNEDHVIIGSNAFQEEISGWAPGDYSDLMVKLGLALNRVSSEIVAAIESS